MGSYSWNGGSGGWGTIANWTGGIPNSMIADATITAAGTYTVSIETGKSYTADSVTLGDGTAILDILGSLTFGGTLATFLDNAGTVELGGVIAGGTVDIEGGSTLLANGGALTGNKHFDLGGSAYINLNSHNLILAGNSTLEGYVIGTGALVISGQATLSNDTYFESGTTLDDTGTITAETSNQFGSGGTATTLLTIAAGGVYDVATPNVALNDDGTFNITNAGTFEMTGAAGYVNVYYNSLTNASTGTIAAVAGSDISLLGTNAALFGHVAGAGELFLDGGTTTLEAGLTITAGTLAVNSYDTLLLASSFSLGNEFDALNAAYLDLNGHNLTLSGTGQVRAYVYGGGTLDVSGSLDLGGLYLASGSELLVTGTAVDDNYNTRLDYDGGTAASILSIAGTGTFDVTQANADIDYNTNRGTFINSGLFENTGTTGTYFNEEENFTNTSTGTVSVIAGQDISLIYGTDDLSGTITGAGGIFIGNGVTATLEASLVLNPSFLTFSDGGSQIILAGSRTIGNVFTLQNAASLHLGGNVLTVDGSGALAAYLVGPGTLDVTGTFTDALYMSSGVTEIVSGAAIQNGTVYLDDDEGTATNVISITSTGTYDVVTDSEIYNGYNNGSGSGTIVNAGLFEKTGLVSYTNIYADFTNVSTGTIFVMEGGDSTAFPATTDFSFLGATNSIAGTITGGGDVYFGAGSSDTLDATAVIGSLTYLTISDGNTQFNIENSRTFTNAFVDESSANLDLNGNTLTLAGISQFINAYVSGAGELAITGTADINGLNVIGTATVLDEGTITQDGYDELGTTNSAQVTLSITTHGIYDIIVDNQINPQNGAPIINAGLFEKTAALGVSDIYSVVTNTSTGTLAAASGIMRLHSGGVLNGTITGAGELDLDGGTFTVAPATLSVANLYLYGGEMVLGKNLAETHLFTQNSGTLDLNGFNFSLANPGDYLANGYVTGPGTLSESGRVDVNNYYLSGGAVLLDTGTITQDGGFNLGTFSGDSSTLSIASTGIYNIVNDNQIGTDDSSVAVINNAGLFEKTAATGVSNIYATFNNLAGATLAVGSGTLQFQFGGALAGTITGAGTVDLSQYYQAQLFTLAAAAVVNVATFGIDGGTLDLAASHGFADHFNESSGDIGLAGFDLTLSGASNLDGGYVSGPGTLDVAGGGELRNYNVVGGTTLLDASTIIADGNLQLGSGGTDSGTLSISTAAVYNIVNDDYIYINGTGTVNNAGLLEKTADNGLSYIQATINNTGVLDAARGTIQLASGGTLGGTLEGAGTIELVGGTFALQSAAVVGVATLQEYSGTVDLLSSRTLTDTFVGGSGATISLASHVLTLTGHDFLQGYAAGPGTVDVTGVSDLNGYNLTGGAVLLDAGTLTMDGGFQIGENGFDTATLSIAAAGTFDILNDNYVYEDGTVAIQNAGLFEKTGSGTGRSYVQGAFTNSATLAVTSGFLEEQALTNDGTVTISNATDQTDNNVVANTGDTGKFLLGGNATLYDVSGLAASQTIILSGTSDLVEIGGGVFAATVTSFAATDTIDVLNVAANGYSFAGNKLTLTENGSIVSTIAVSTVSGAGTFSLVQDSAGNGTDVELSKPGSITEPGSITTDVFTAGSGDFNAAGNWSAGKVPGASNIAQDQSAGTVTDAGTDTVYQMSFNNTGLTFSQSGGVLNVIDGGLVGSGILIQAAGATINDEAGTLSLPEEGTIAGTLSGAGSIEIGGNPGNGQSAVTIAASAVLSVATLSLGNVLLGGSQSYAGVFAGPGSDFLGLNGFTLNLLGQSYLAPTYEYSVTGPGELILADNAVAADLNIYSSATVAVTGTLIDDQNISFGAGGGDASVLTIGSAGTLDLIVNGNVDGDYAGATTLANAGLLEKTTDNGSSSVQYLDLIQSATGEIDAVRGTISLYSDAGTLAGTLAGNFIDLLDSQLTLSAGAALSVATLQIAGSGTISLASNRTYAGNFDMSGGGGGTLALGSFGLNLTGISELGGEYVGGSGTLTVSGTADVSGMQLINSATLLDTGSIIQDGGFTLGYYSTDTTELTVASGGIYDIINDSNIGANGTAAIVNAGLFEKTADNGISYIAPVFTNASTGTIDVVAGTIDLQSGGMLAGLIEGVGELELQNNNGTFTLASTAVVTVATLDVNENLVFEHAETFTGDFIQTNNVDLNGFNLSLAGTAALDSSVQGKGTLTVTNGDVGGLYLYDDAVMVVKGTVTQDGGFTMSNTGTDNTVLSIASGGVFDLLTDNSINANGTAAINNAGLFEKSGDYGTSYIYPSFNNTGTLDVVRGNLDFENGGSLSGTIEGGKDGTIADGSIFESGGTLTLASTATVSVAAINVNGGDLSFGGNLTYAGSLSGTGGSLSLNGHTISLTAPYLGGFYLTGPGTLDVSGTATLNGLGEISGAHLVDKGTIIQDGGYQIGYSATDTSALSIISGATFDIITDNYIGADGSPGIQNAGLFEKTADNGYSGIQDAFTNASTGVINVTHGTLAFQAGGTTLSGTLKGAGEIQIDDNAVLTSSVVSVATLDIADVLTLGTNLTYGGFLDLQYSDTVILNAHTLLLSGTGALIGGFEGPGVATVSGKAYVQTLDLFGGSTLVDTGFINQIDELRFGLNDGSSDTLSVASTGTYDIQDDSNFHSYGNAGSAEVAINAGLLEKTGDTGLSELEVTLTNTGTLLVSSGTLQVDAVSNLSAGTLAGGTYVVDAGLLGPTLALAGGTLAVDAAAITLSGAGSELIAGGTLIEQSLTSIAAGGKLAVLGGRGFTAAQSLTNAGGVVLQGGTFAAPTLTIASGGTLSGQGVVTGPVADSGLIDVTGTTLTIANSVTGTGGLLIGGGDELILGAGAASGNGITFGGSLAVLGLDAPASVLGTLVSLAPSDTIDLIGLAASSATITGGDLIVSLTAGGTLSYALSAANALDRLATHADGSGGTDITVFRQATAGTVAPASENFGQHHTGVALTQTYTIASTAAVNPYSENLDGSMGATTGGVMDSGSFTGLAPGAKNSTSLMASLVTSAGGLISGTALVNLESDGSGVAGDGNGTLALPPETVTLTGTIFNYATASAAVPDPVAFGEHHVGATLSQKLTLDNLAVAGKYSENLDAKFSGTSSDITAGGTISELIAGASNASSLSIGLHTGTAGAFTGTTTLGLTSDGKNIDSLSATALAAETITVTGTLFNYATASTVAPATIAFGEHHVGTTVSQKLTIANLAAAGGYSENLDARFSGTSSDLTGSGTISELAAGSTNSSGLVVSLHTGTAGVFTGTGTVGLTSDGSTLDTLGTTALAAQTVTAAGTLFNYATEMVAPKPVSFGQHHVGDTLSQILTITNSAAAGAYSENLDVRFSGTSTNLTASGTISELAAGSADSSALSLVLNSGTAGTHTGTATLAAVSDGSTIDTLGTTALTAQTVSVTSTLFNYATASTASPVNFGIVHVGQTVSHYITLSNKVVVGAYSENLDASLSGTTADFTTTGALNELAAGKTSTASLDAILQTGTAGTFSGTTTLGLVSDGSTIDTLGTTALAAQTVALTGTVNNYATATIETISGPGTLTGSGTSFALNLGSVTKGSAPVIENIGILNSATGPADNLSGTFVVSGSSEIGHSGLSTFSSEGAGQAYTAPMLTLSTGTLGTFTETIYVEGKGSNASGYSGTLAHETLVVTGTVVAAGQVVAHATDATDTATPIAASPTAMTFVAPAATPAKAADVTPAKAGLASWAEVAPTGKAVAAYLASTPPAYDTKLALLLGGPTEGGLIDSYLHRLPWQTAAIPLNHP